METVCLGRRNGTRPVGTSLTNPSSVVDRVHREVAVGTHPLELCRRLEMR